MARDATLPVGFSGSQATMIRAALLSRTAEAAITKGAPVLRGTVGAIPTGASASQTAFLGIATADAAKDQTVRIITKGDVWVDVGSAVSAGDPVSFVRASGAWGNATSGAANTLVSGARYDSNSVGSWSSVTVTDMDADDVDGLKLPTITTTLGRNPDIPGTATFKPEAANMLKDTTGKAPTFVVTVDGVPFTVEMGAFNYTSGGLAKLVIVINAAIGKAGTAAAVSSDIVITSATVGGQKAKIRMSGKVSSVAGS